MNKAKLLVDIILDKKCDWAERQDALFDLHNYYDDFIEDALTQLITDSKEDHALKSDACETLALFWINNNHYNIDKFNKIEKIYQNEILIVFNNLKPEWAAEYKKKERQA